MLLLPEILYVLSGDVGELCSKRSWQSSTADIFEIAKVSTGHVQQRQIAIRFMVHRVVHNKVKEDEQG